MYKDSKKGMFRLAPTGPAGARSQQEPQLNQVLCCKAGEARALSQFPQVGDPRRFRETEVAREPVFLRDPGDGTSHVSVQKLRNNKSHCTTPI